jgi:hypothetical protein
MGLTFTGTKEMADAIKQIAEKYPDKVKGGLYRVATSRILKPVQDVRIPVATGNAAASGHVVAYKDRLRVDVVFGGPVGGGGDNDRDANYVVPLHENLKADHSKHGEAKFLENQMNEESGTFRQDLTDECELAGRPTDWGKKD